MSKIPNSNIQTCADFGDFIENRRKELGLSKSELVRKLGYKNLSKGCQKYQNFISGDIEQPFIRQNLDQALSLDPEELSFALERIRKNIIEAESLHYEKIDFEWRDTFKVHGIIETERTIPQPIFVAVYSGSVKTKMVELDTSQNAPSYTQQMIDEIPNRVFSDGTIIAFGKPIGFVINLAPDHAIRYDLEGNKLEELEAAILLGGGYMRIR